MSAARMGALHVEHVLLGARFESQLEEGPVAVEAYEREGALDEAVSGALLADLTGSAYLLVSGPGSEALGAAALAGAELSVGQAAFQAVLAGDGRLLAAPLAIRTGAHEIVLLDPTDRGPTLAAWLEFLRSVEADGSRPYATASVDEASSMLVPLVLWGERASSVLLDYVGSEPLPAPGRACQMRLDAIPAVVARASVPEGLGACYVLLVPPAAARRLWRSLLSFTEVTPVGRGALKSLMAQGLPWGRLLDVSSPALPSARELGAWGLVRPGGGFVGARALKAGK